MYTLIQFACDDGQCVLPSVRCDGNSGYGNCADGSDERNCPRQGNHRKCINIISLTSLIYGLIKIYVFRVTCNINFIITYICFKTKVVFALVGKSCRISGTYLES